MVVTQGARVVFVGVAIGLIFAAVTTRVLTALLFEVNPLDVTTFVATATAMIGIGLLATVPTLGEPPGNRHGLDACPELLQPLLLTLRTQQTVAASAFSTQPHWAPQESRQS